VADGGHEFFAGFMGDYFAECEEHLVSVRGLLLTLERAVGAVETDPGLLEELFRSFHSIKGISGMVELREAEMLAHEMESYLRALRQRDALVSQAGVDALIAGVDALEHVIAARRDNRAAPGIGAAIRQIASVVPAASPGSPVTRLEPGAPPQWIVTFSPSSELNARGINVDAVRNRLRERGTILTAAPRVLPSGISFEFGVAGDLNAEMLESWKSDGISAEPAPAPIAPSEGEGAGGTGGVDPSSPSAAPVQYVRVDLARLDEVMRMIGDLVISRSRLEDTLAPLEARIPAVQWRAVHDNSTAIERQLRDLREGIVRMRLVPVGEICRRMPFVVRDLNRESGAKVQLVLRGQGTEIDKFLIERMMDPILHLVRNAVSHGFESPADRRSAGKPEEGTLTLSASTAGDSVVLEIADDGRGIDAADVARRARLAGLAVPDGPVDAATVLDLICGPGPTTAPAIDPPAPLSTASCRVR